MRKEKNRSNSKKNKNDKVTDTKLTKAKNKKKENESKVRVLDTIEEEYIEEENYEEEFENDNEDDIEIEDEDVDYEDDEEIEDEDDDYEDDEEIEDEDDDYEDDEEIEDEDNDYEDDEEIEDEDDDYEDDEEIEDEDDNYEDEDDYEDDEEIENEEHEDIEKIKNEKTNKKEKNTSKDKIKKIEQIAKEKKKKTSFNGEKVKEVLLLLDKYRYSIYCFLGGIIITTLIAFIIWPERIATLKNGEEPVVKVGKETYTANELYESMKEFYSVNLLLDDIDDNLLTKLYPENEEMTKEVNSNVEYYLNMYKQYYGQTEEQFLESNGFTSRNQFIEYLTLDYRRNKYTEDYIKENLTNEEIENYYKKNVFGDINVQHILVEYSDKEDALSKEDAKELAEEIITKLNDGTSWETIQKDYKSKITFEDLGYQSWDASLEKSFMDALKDMENNSYSEEPVSTSYGYHVIYRIDQKETPKLKDVKEIIIENLITDKKSKDSKIQNKALIYLREKNNINFSDTVMKAKYETYCEKYK